MEFTLQIEKLGLVEDSEITLKPFTLIYGDNNLNKSYVLLALFFVQKLLTSTEITWEEQKSPILNKEDLKQFEISKEKALDYIRKWNIEGNFKELLKKIEFDSNLKFYYVNFKDFENLLNTKIAELLTSFFEDAISIARETTENWKIYVKINKVAYQEALVIPLYTDVYFTIYKKEDEIVSNLEGKILPFIEWFFKELMHNKAKFKSEKKLLFIAFNKFSESEILKGLYKRFLQAFLDKSINAKFIPPARGCISDFLNALVRKAVCKESTEYLAGLYRDLIEEIINPRIYKVDNKKSQQSIEIFKKLFEFEAIQTREGIKFKDLRWNIEGDITFASSSIKELAPIYRLLAKGFSGSLYIEEPELHLHPKNQMKMAMFLSALTNIGYNIAITTHSDFLVSMLGNLISLKFLKEKKPKIFEMIKEELPIPIEDKYLLDSKRLGVYWFKESKGKVKIEKVLVSKEGIPLKAFEREIDALYKLTEILEEEL